LSVSGTPNPARRWPYWLTGLLLGGLTAWLAVRQVRWSVVLGTLRAVRPGYLALAVGCTVGVAVLKAVRWQRLLAPAGKSANWRIAFSVLVLAQLTNIAVPVRGAGEVLRVGLVMRRAHLSALHVGATLVVEKAVDLLALGAIALAVLPAFAPAIGLHGGWSWAMPLLLAATLLGLAILVYSRGTLAGWLARWPTLQRNLEQLRAGLTALVSWASAAALLLLTAAIWLLSLSALFLTLQATRASIPLVGV
jgi:uncharacterized membrane protein YbhN (UPF0104 family)